MALAHFKAISDATDLPLIVFQYPLATGQGYPAATLNRLLDEMPTIRAIKDWTPRCRSTSATFARCRRASAHQCAVHQQRLAVEFAGARLQWVAVRQRQRHRRSSGQAVSRGQANDLAEARRLNDRIYPLMGVFYADPFIDMHNRMKEALVLLGRLPRAVVRPPLVKITDAEIARIRDALVEAGLLGSQPAQGRNAA